MSKKIFFCLFVQNAMRRPLACSFQFVMSDEFKFSNGWLYPTTVIGRIEMDDV